MVRMPATDTSIRPDLRQQIVLRHETPSLPDQQDKNVEGLRRVVDHRRSMCDGDFQGEPAKMEAVSAAHGDFGKYQQNPVRLGRSAGTVAACSKERPPEKEPSGDAYDTHR
jgi:hypothetical protein